MQKAPTASRCGAASKTLAETWVLLLMPSTSTSGKPGQQFFLGQGAVESLDLVARFGQDGRGIRVDVFQEQDADVLRVGALDGHNHSLRRPPPGPGEIDRYEQSRWPAASASASAPDIGRWVPSRLSLVRHGTTVGAVMNAPVAVMVRLGQIEIEERPVPEPGPGQVLIEVSAVGVCGSDVHWFTEGRIGEIVVDGPLVLGHEAAGVVRGLGPGVSRLSVGQRVALEPGVPCRRCRACRSGHYNLCPDIRFFATPPVDGAFARLRRSRRGLRLPARPNTYPTTPAPCSSRCRWRSGPRGRPASASATACS